MTYVLVTPPAAEPISLADLKAHLRLDGAQEDTLLAGLIRAARDHLERTTALALVTQTWRLHLDSWPEAGPVEIGHGPVSAIIAIRAFDELGEENEIALSGHVLDGARRPGRLWLRQPPTPRQAINGIEVDFTAGFGETGAEVPDTLKRAMLVHAAHMYEFRGAVPLGMQPASVPEGYDLLVAPFLIRRL